MKRLVRFTVFILLFELFTFAGQAAFTSLYVFGDGACTTTNNFSTHPTWYYGHRYCNGRVWVEVLSERQSLTYDPNKNWSYFGHYSKNMVINVTNFIAPPDAATALFAIWVNDADFVWDVNNYNPFTTSNIAIWTNAINQSLTNHLKAIQNLYYNKGARTFIMPNAVDITKSFNWPGLSSAQTNFIRQRIIDFNTSFAVMLDQARSSLAGIAIYTPDTFTLLDNLVAHPANYGFTNSSYDATEDGYTALNGPGTNYVFWDYLNPSAKVQEIIAEITQPLISPVQISKFTLLNGSNQLDVMNIPIGLDGFVDGSTDLIDWTSVQNIDSTNATESILVPSSSAPPQFYRLRFPFAWSWP